MTLAELRALSERATKGPWTWNDWSQDDGPDRTTLQAVVPFQDDFERRLWAQTSPHGRPARIVGCDDCDGEASAADRELIAAARTWLPALIEVAEAAQMMIHEVEHDVVGEYSSPAIRAIRAALARLAEMK